MFSFSCFSRRLFPPRFRTLRKSVSGANLLAFCALSVWFLVAGAQAAEPAADRNYMGLGIAHADNANQMLSAREPGIVSDFSIPTTTDADGWPTTDSAIYICDGAVVKNGHGTYGLRFKGQADISCWFVDAVINKNYDPVANSTTAQLVVSNPSPNLVLILRNTRRTSSSALNTGVTNIRLMRPTTPGSNTPYPFGTLFTDNARAMASKFSAIRAMDLRATNSNNDQNWSDRTRPANATYARKPKDANGNSLYGWQGMGVPWEHVIAFANATNCDLWINVPAKANDDYILKLAQMTRWGSDGANPYTATQTSPVWAPLNSGLKLYIEYSNELWNTAPGFRQYHDNMALARNEPANSPIRYDGNTGDAALAWRRVAYRTVVISNIFRSVWGDSQMMTRIRPVFEWQYGDGQNTGSTGLRFVDDYYNNQAGNFVSTPRPVNYFFWGGGAAAYYEPANMNSTTLTVDQILFESRVSNRPAQWNDKLVDIGWTSVYGLKRSAYEGGLALGDDPSQSLAAKKATLADSRLKDVVIANQNTWSNYGGDLLMYFESSDSVGYGHTDQNFSLSTPKLQGIDALSAATRAPMTLGQAIPATVPGGAFAPNFSATGVLDSSFGPSSVNYVLRAASAGTYTVKINYNAWTTANSVRFLANGVWGSSVALPTTGGIGNTTAASVTTTVPLVAGKNGVRLALARGDARIVSLEWTLGTASPTPTPTPTPSPTPTPTPTNNAAQNGSFETPNIGTANYSYNTSGATWTFSGNSGIQNNGSPWNAPSAPDGVQTAFLQGLNGNNGTISQSWNWSAGTYTVSFRAAQRYHNNATNNQGIRVLLNDTLLTTITPSGTSFSTYTLSLIHI